MRRLYSFCLILLTPAVFVYFAFRGLRDRRYWQRWKERLALGQSVPEGPYDLHIHAASLGEVNAASPLIEALLCASPPWKLLVTSTTPTGSDRVRSLFAKQLDHCYLPLDLTGAGRRFLRRAQPRCAVMIETEIWPNFYALTAREDIPLVIANARMSRRSLRGYQQVRGIITPALSRVRWLLAQSRRDGKRFAECGVPADRIEVTGNLKFDMSVPASVGETGELLRVAWGPQRNVLVAGSTHEDDETALFDAFSRLLKNHPGALLVVAPRHPERFGAAAQAASQAGLTVCRLSQRRVPGPEQQCLLVDTMGELVNYYAAADVTFVGGTIADIGGHNVLEPAALGKPLLIGPSTANVRETTSRLLETGAARRVISADDIENWTDQLFRHPAARDRMGQAGLRLMKEGKGAVGLTLGTLEQLLSNDPADADEADGAQQKPA